MQQNNQSKKVLLKITDLKQWFPIKKTKLFQKEQLYVRANDGITLDIYEGETVGLVGESGCGKSTFGRTLLQLYPQTEGKTMYYGRTLWEMAPDYVEHTVKNIVSRKKKIRELEQKTREMRAEYEKMADGAEKFKKQETCEKVRKECNREFLDLVQIIGGFYAIESTQEAEHMILNQFKIAKELRELKEDPVKEASAFAEKYHAITVLKDARTVTALPGGDVFINRSGNSGMATGGSGDVLTGVLAGLAGQGCELSLAAPLGVYLHGLAGDEAARKRGKRGMTASDIAQAVGIILKEGFAENETI